MDQAGVALTAIPDPLVPPPPVLPGLLARAVRLSRVLT